MILLIDAGNTRLKWGLWQAGGWVAKGWLPTDEVAGLAEVLAGRRPGWVGVSCVAGGEARSRLEAQLAGLGCPLFWLRAEARRYGLFNRYTDPASLGPDRYAMLLACRYMGLAPCVVVGAGTALTVDALNGTGEFLGGLILPGAGLMRRSLLAGTAGVAEVAGRVCGFPRSTGDGVETGILLALPAAVEAMRKRLAAQAGDGVQVILSGGDGPLLAGHIAPPVRVVEDLVLEGLSWIARKSDWPGA